MRHARCPGRRSLARPAAQAQQSMVACGPSVALQTSVTLPSRTWATFATGTCSGFGPAGDGQGAQRDGVLVVGQHIMNIQPERAGCLRGQPGEETEDIVPAVV